MRMGKDVEFVDEVGRESRLQSTLSIKADAFGATRTQGKSQSLLEGRPFGLGR